MLAFTFPGQGSQRPGMGRPWVDHESWELVGEASEIAGRDIAALLLDADAEALKDTRNAQLTTFVSSLMVLDAVERLGIEPSFCAGHSLGEYTALAATGALGFDDGVRLVIERAAAMHEAGNESPGTMSAVLGLDDEDVDSVGGLLAKELGRLPMRGDVIVFSGLRFEADRIEGRRKRLVSVLVHRDQNLTDAQAAFGVDENEN